MQQTEKLSLNLIEGSDPVNWEVLNDNFKSLDKTVSTVSGLSQAAADFIGSAKNCCISYGQYAGSGTYGQTNPTELSFDFCPVLVVVGSSEHSGYQDWPAIMLRGATSGKSDFSSSPGNSVTWTENGVSWWNYYAAKEQNNLEGRVYYYAALGYPA